MTVSERVGQYIAQHGIEKGHIAKALDISEEELEQLLSGGQPLDVDLFRKLCLALNVSPEYFIEFDSDHFTKGTNEHE